MKTVFLYICTSEEYREDAVKKAKRLYLDMPVVLTDHVEDATNILVLPDGGENAFEIEEAKKKGAIIHYTDYDLVSYEKKEELLMEGCGLSVQAEDMGS